MSSATLGVSVHGNVQECLEQAGLAYTVASAPVAFFPETEVEGEGEARDVPRHFVTYRADTKQPFGVV